MLDVIAGTLSLLTLLVFWHGPPFLFPNKLGAIAADVAVAASLVWFKWPSEIAVP
jgi:hypothetical protein